MSCLGVIVSCPSRNLAFHFSFWLLMSLCPYMHQGAAYDCVGNDCEKWNCTICENYPKTVVKRLRDETKNANGFVGYVESLHAIVLAFAGSSTASTTNW